MVSVRGNQTNNKVTASSSTSTNNRAEVKPITINNQVEATNNLAKYYSEISQDWAIGEGLIQNIDYSSKTYALQAKESATEAKASLDEAKGYTDNAVEQIQNVENLALSNISMLEQSASSTVEQGISNIGETVSEALTTLETASDATIEEIKSASDKIINRVSFELFDTKLSDHILTYEETKGWALQGTFVYKEAIAGERYGYPDFIAECIKQKNESEAIEVTLGENTIIMYQHTNGHKFYAISDKDAVDTWYNTYKIADFYGVDEENESVFLPRNDYFMQLTCDITKVNEMNEAGLPTLTTNSTGAHTHTRGTMEIWGNIAVHRWDDLDGFPVDNPNGAFYNGGAVSLSPAPQYSNTARNGYWLSFNASRHWTGETSSNGAHTHTIEGNADTVQPPSSNKLLYYCVGTTVADTSWIDIVTQVEAGVKDLDDKKNICIEEINTTSTEINTIKTNAINEVKEEGQTQLNNIKSTGFYMRDDKLYFINSEGVEEEFKSGGGLEIGDIGIAPLGIDETQNKRRYLNGQIIIQDQFVSFTEKVKKAKELYPVLFCTEEQWQATVTMSAFGQCGKFVINDEAGTIRLPKITGFIQGLTDLASLGELVEAGLPTHTHTRGTMNMTGQVSNVYGGGTAGLSGWGVFTPSLNTTHGAFNSGTKYNSGSTITFDASRNWTGETSVPNNATYGKSNTVQPESIRYPYFIQVATGVEESVDVTREIELNNPYSLLDVKWSDKLLNNISWLRSEGQANSKAVYNDVYDLILREYNSGTDETETVGGISITFRRGSETNIKVTTDKSAYDSILSATGTAWYYVIDTANEAFYLPQSDGFLQFGGNGEFVGAGLPNITGIASLHSSETANIIYSCAGAIYGAGGNTTAYRSPANLTQASGAPSYGAIHIDASRSSSIYGNSKTVQPNAVKGYLYFYVGETVQNANLVNAGRIEEIKANRSELDGQWIYKGNKAILTQVSVSATFNQTYDLSSILPDDGNVYDVDFWGYGYTASTASSICSIVLNGGYSDVQLCKVDNMDRAINFDWASSVRVLVDTNRQLQVMSGGAANTSTVWLYVASYRKVR